MKKVFIAMFLLTGCGDGQTVELIPGPAGKAGLNGHSLVSLLGEVSDTLLCVDGGKSLDVYLDLDDSLSVSDGDQYQNSLIACNGLNGLQGSQGLAGTSGLNGSDGQDGSDGLDGENGADGQDGAQGEKGDKGDQGEQGEMGPQGEQGIQGEKGDKGDRGPRGKRGKKGKQGIPGAQGPAGPQGLQGEMGPVGPQGEQGPTGPQGDPGLQGPQGETGPQGPAGSGTQVTITSYSSSSCTYITGSSPSHYAKSGKVYSSSSCHSGSELATQTGETVWVGPNALATDSGSSVRVIVFN